MSEQYDSTERVVSRKRQGVSFTVRRMSFLRRVELMRRIRELAGRMEFAGAGTRPEEQMEAGILRAEIDRVYLEWGLAGVGGLEIDGGVAGPKELIESGPEELVLEALEALKSSAGLSEAERKN